MDPTALKLDDEQDVEALEEDGVDREEVALEDGRRLPAQKLRPARLEPPRRRLDPRFAQNRPDRARRDPDAEPNELSLDPSVPPARVLARQAHDQLADVDRSFGTPGAPLRMDGHRSNSLGAAPELEFEAPDAHAVAGAAVVDPPRLA